MIQQQLSQIAGVGQITLGGGALPSVRVELEPDKLSSYGIGLEDVRAAIVRRQRRQRQGSHRPGRPALRGHCPTIRRPRRRTTGIWSSPTATARRCCCAMSPRSNDSNENIRNAGLYNDKPAVGVIVYPMPGANIVKTVAQIRKVLPSIEATLPPSVHVNIAMDRSQSVTAAVGDTERTLISP